MTQIYLDCDGVLADFANGACEVFGVGPREYERIHGTETFWKVLEEAPGLYANLEKMPDADELVGGVIDIATNLGLGLPIILTACPWGDWAAPQKLIWKNKYFQFLEMITTDGGQNKYKHCNPGDILIDDYMKYKTLWEEAGGIFIHHINTPNSLKLLGEELNYGK